MKRRSFVTAITLFGAGALAGCSGDGGGTPTDTPTPTDTDVESPAPTTGTPTDAPETTTAPGDGETDTPGTATETETPGQPLGEDPAALLSIEGGSVQVGGTRTLTGTLENPYLFPVGPIEVTLDPPNDDWTVSATGATSFDSLGSNNSQQIEWEVTVPDDADGEYTMNATVSYASTTDSANVSISHSVIAVDLGDVPQDGLVAYFPLDGDTPEEVVSGGQATIEGDVSTGVTGVANGAFEFTDGIVDLPEFPIDGTGATIALWVNADEWPSERAQLAYWGDNPPNFELTVNGGNLDAFYWDGSQVRGPGPTDVAIPTGEWVHYATTYDEDTATWRVYLNGEEVATAEDDVDMEFSGVESRLGNHPGSPDLDRQFDGRLDDVQFYRRALSADEIGSLAGQ